MKKMKKKNEKIKILIGNEGEHMEIPKWLKFEYMTKWQKLFVAFGIAMLLGLFYIIGFYLGFAGGYESGLSKCVGNAAFGIG